MESILAISALLGILLFLLFMPTHYAYTSESCAPLVPQAGHGGPVWEHANQIDYANTPISEHRVGNFFVCPPSAGVFLPEDPILTIVTPAHNPKPVLWETMEFLRRQSLRRFAWIIVNDHSTSHKGYRMLREIEREGNRHFRVLLVNNTGPKGLPSARNYALNHPALDTKYVAFLDDDDMLELTTYEKTTWLLESNPQIDIAGFYTVGFGATNFTWDAGFHKLDDLYRKENQLCGTMTIRRSSIGDLRYDSTRTKGAEDWDFWLTMAEAGKWGYTIPENLYWYRQNPKAARMRRWPGLKSGGGLEATLKSIRRRHEALTEGVPQTMPEEGRAWQRQLEDSVLQETAIWPGPPNDKHLLVILPWLFVGGTEKLVLGMMEHLTRKGWRVSVACTLYDGEKSTALRPQFMQWTHDVFFLPDFLHPKDHPSFLRYLIYSRKIRTVLMTNTQLGYELLPYLRKHSAPGTRFVDLVHAEQMEFKEGGYPWVSTVFSEHLDRTIAISHHVEQFMVERGKPPEQIGVIQPGINSTFFTRDGPAPDGNPDGPLRVVMVARMDEGKRPLMAIRAMAEARAAGGNEISLAIVGGGPLLEAAKQLVENLGLESHVELLGQQSRLQTHAVLSRSDVFFLPTAHEGISIAVLEGMSMTMPALSTLTGGLPEIIQENGQGGVLVEYTGDEQTDTKAYAAVLTAWAADRPLVARMASQARDIALSFDIEAKLEMWEGEFRTADVPVPTPRISASSHLAIANALKEYAPYISMRKIEAERRVPPREPGPGLELQRHCGESEEHMTKWIDGFAKAVGCEGLDLGSVKNLHQSAFHQCGSWCIFDLTTPKLVGWEFTGGCFLTFGHERKSPCTNGARPSVNL